MDLWPKALDISNRHDRIHLRNTCFKYAKFCEQRNDLGMAIEMYAYYFETDKLVFFLIFMLK